MKEYIKTIIDLIVKYYPFIFFVIIMILSVSLFQTCSTLKTERENNKLQEQLYNQNMNALGDSITAVFNKKLNAYEYSKDNYVLQKLNDLEKYDKTLYNELKNVKGDVLAAVKTEVQGDLGGISTSNNVRVLDENTNYYGLDFSNTYKDEGFEQKLAGTSKFYVIPDETTKKWNIKSDVTAIDTNLTTIKITYGFKDYNDKYQVFAISKSDKVKITDLTGGYFIDKQIVKPAKIKKWGVGPYVGGGLNTDFKNGIGFGYSIGVGVTYDIFQW